MSTCQSCRNTNPGPLTRQGFQSCKLGVSYTYFPSKHTCDKYEPKPQAPVPDKPNARAEFLAHWAKQRAVV